MYVLMALYDRKTESYSALVQERTEAAALRNFGDQIASGQAQLVSSHPEDFDLVKFGEFDENLGIVNVEAPYVLINAAALVRQLKEGKPVQVVEELRDEDRLRVGENAIEEVH